MTNPSALYLPGTSGNYPSASSGSGEYWNADGSISAYVALDDWTPAAKTTVISKWGGGAVQNWGLFVDTTGVLQVGWYDTGDSLLSYYSSTSAPTVSNGEFLWIGVSVDVNNGASDCDIKFWTGGSNLDSPSWVQLGSTVNKGSVAQPQSGLNGNLFVGYSSGITVLVGKLIRASGYTGIGANTAPGQGTLVAEFRADAPIEPRYRDSTGKIWTLNGSAYSFVEVS